MLARAGGIHHYNDAYRERKRRLGGWGKHEWGNTGTLAAARLAMLGHVSDRRMLAHRFPRTGAPRASGSARVPPIRRDGRGLDDRTGQHLRGSTALLARAWLSHRRLARSGS